MAQCVAMNNEAKRIPTTKPGLQIYHTFFRRHPALHLPILPQRTLKEAHISFTFRRTSVGSRSDCTAALARKLFVRTKTPSVPQIYTVKCSVCELSNLSIVRAQH